MKKFAVILSLILVLFEIKAFAFPPPSPLPPPRNNRANINVGGNYTNTAKTQHHTNAVNHIIINNKPPVHIMPPPPPPKYFVRYKDDRRLPARSYYIPSYCMPDTGFYNNAFNPFCNHYRPYGSSMYISF